MKRIIFLFGLVILTSCTYNELAVCETDNPSFSDKVHICNSLSESINETDVILILTEWDEFKTFKTDSKVIDTRNIYNGNKYFKL